MRKWMIALLVLGLLILPARGAEGEYEVEAEAEAEAILEDVPQEAQALCLRKMGGFIRRVGGGA